MRTMFRPSFRPVMRMMAVALLAGFWAGALSTFALAEQPGVRCVQNQLNALGFNSGRPDGTIGSKTRQASEEYRHAWRAGREAMADRYLTQARRPVLPEAVGP